MISGWVGLFHHLLVVAAGYFLLLTVCNVLWLRVASSVRRSRTGSPVLVSVLVPARDEEESIGACLDSLLSQTHAPCEILVLDDESSDRTWSIVTSYARRHPDRVRALRGGPLPQGWNGKPHAMQQLAAQARGEYLMFTDADTVHSPSSVAWALAAIRRHRADLLSGYVAQELRSFGEILVVPVTYIMTALILPLWLVPRTRAGALSMAIGQLMFFRRSAFDAIGGYESVRDQISEDMAAARALKRAGFRAVFLDARRQVRCRMYRGYRASYRGISKNIHDFFRHRPLFFAAAASLLALFVLLPVLLLPLELAVGSPLARLSALSVATFLLAWAVCLYDRGLVCWAPLVYPLAFLHLFYMAWRCFGRVRTGGVVLWKGREVR